MSLSNVKNISIIGGGISTVLLCNEAAKRGIATTLLDPDIGCLGANVATEHMIGRLTKENLEKLAFRSDAIVYNGTACGVIDEKLKCNLYPKAQVINQLNNRYELLQMAQSLKIPVPAFYYQENKSLFMQDLKEISIPFRFYQLFEDRIEKSDILSQSDLSNFIFEVDEKADAWLIEEINTYEKIVISIVINDHNNKGVVYSAFEKTFLNNSLNNFSTPPTVSKTMLQKLNTYTNKITKHLEGPGVFSIKYGIKKNRSVELLNIVPKIDITGIMTQTSFDISIYEQTLNMLLGYPLVTPNQTSSAKAYVFSEDKKGHLPAEPNGAFHIYSAKNNHIYIEQIANQNNE